MSVRNEVAGGAVLLTGIAWIVTGCEDAAKKSVARAQVPRSTITTLKQGSDPVTSPTPTNTALAADNTSIPLQLAPLPIFAPKRRSLVMLPPALGGSKEELIARGEQKIASGGQNYKGGHLEAARKDFDEAVDAMLGSGHDL